MIDWNVVGKELGLEPAQGPILSKSSYCVGPMGAVRTVFQASSVTEARTRHVLVWAVGHDYMVHVLEYRNDTPEMVASITRWDRVMAEDDVPDRVRDGLFTAEL